MADTVVPGDPFGSRKTETQSKRASATEVQDFHKQDDVDSSKLAHHHTLGTRRNQAAPGDHIHDGENGLLIMSGVTLTGAKGGSAVITSIVAALVTLGAIDNTT